MSIIKLLPSFQDYLWGGVKLKTEYGKNTPLNIVAESWELSTHPAGPSYVANGVYKGKTFAQYLGDVGFDALGCDNLGGEFPLLIKFIDAKEQLSIQVHPDDTYAKIHENGQGKTEMWYVMEARDGAYIYKGFTRSITKDEVRQRIEDQTLIDVLNKISVKKGDVFMIEAGVVHALGAGIMVCEIQQNSNATYRVYDYGRRDSAGRLRPLHIDKALDVAVLDVDQTTQQPTGSMHQENGYHWQLLKSCDYFTSYQLTIETAGVVNSDSRTFTSLICLSGDGTIAFENDVLAFKKGDSFFMPAIKGVVRIDGQSEWIVTKRQEGLGQ